MFWFHANNFIKNAFFLFLNLPMERCVCAKLKFKIQRKFSLENGVPRMK